MGMVAHFINEMTGYQRVQGSCLPLKTKGVSQPGSKPKSDPTTLKFGMGQELNSVAPFQPHCASEKEGPQG